LGENDQGRQTLSTGGGLAGEVSLGLTTRFSGVFAGPIVAATSEHCAEAGAETNAAAAASTPAPSQDLSCMVTSLKRELCVLRSCLRQSNRHRLWTMVILLAGWLAGWLAG
jgi:hypothetical protein